MLRRRIGRTFVLIGLISSLWCACATGEAAEPPRPGREEPVRLPPLLVESSTGQPWLHYAEGDIEVLSRCSKATTERLILAFVRARQGLDGLIPPDFRLRTSAPEIIVLYDAALWPRVREEAIATMLLARSALPRATGITNLEATHAPSARTSNSGGGSGDSSVVERLADLSSTPLDSSERHRQTSTPGAVGGYVLPGTSVRPDEAGVGGADSLAFFSNIRLADADTLVTFALVSGGDVAAERSVLTSESVAQLITARVPQLPRWFITGFLSLYGRAEFATDGIYVPECDGPSVETLGRGLIPLSEFVQSEYSAKWPADLWTAQAELLVRWGIDPTANRQSGFWQYLRRSAEKPGDLAAFQECLGMSPEAANADLRNYLPKAARKKLTWKRQPEPRLTGELQEASRTQVARIRGEWERLETRYVRKHLPVFEQPYLTQARTTVAKAYERGDRDPQLLATYGLLLLDAGDPAAATSLLREATSASVARPRAYYELARLEFENALNRSRRNDGKIEGEAAALILDLISKACRQSPPLSATYELLADILANRPSEPNGAELFLLDQGLRLFQREPQLHYRAALVYKTLGEFERADELARAALESASPQLARVIEELRAQMAAGASRS